MEDNSQKYFERGLEILKRLNDMTYEAYFIGGVVRDYLLGEPFQDIDIATSATPEEVLQLFPAASSEYAALGCVMLTEEVGTFEITTFRIEEYDESRHPKRIHYSLRLEEDVKRRDFTVNAIAMTQTKKIIDLLDGSYDIKNRIVRVIGKPKIRFREDPLRIYRALSLVARYRFSIEEKTLDGMRATRKFLSEVAEVKSSEALIHIMSAPYGKKALKYLQKIKAFPYLVTYEKGLPYVIKKYRHLSLEEKFALIYYINGKIPANTIFPKETVALFKQMIEVATLLTKEAQIPVLIYRYGSELVLSGNRLNTRVIPRYFSKQRSIIKKAARMQICQNEPLVFRGQDLLELANGEAGSFMGTILDTLKEKVILGELRNDFTVLRAAANQMLEEYRNNQNGEAHHPVQDVVPSSDISLDELSANYDIEYNQVLANRLAQIAGLDTMDVSEKAVLIKQIKKDVQALLLEKNSNYRKLVEAGIINEI